MGTTDGLIEYVDPAAVRLDPRNARKHSAEQLALVRGLIRDFGFRSCILVDEEGVLIAGEARVLAARDLGIAHVPAMRCIGLSAERRAALALADNRAPLDAEWNLDVLSSTVRWLDGAGFDVSTLGFSQDEVLELLGSGEGDGERVDVVPEPPVTPESQTGDVWVCGPHRVVCGDATDEAAYKALLGDERIDLCWTDPPYNVDYDGKASVKGGVERKIAGDKQEAGAFSAMLGSAFRRVFAVMKQGAALYVAHSETQRAAFSLNVTQAGFKTSGVVIWRKDSLVLGRSDYQWEHEPVLYGWKPGAPHRWYGGRRQTTVADYGGEVFEQEEDGSWVVRAGGRLLRVSGDAKVQELESSVIRVPRPRRSEAHPTMKPLQLIERMLRNSGRPGDLVLDPFGGSGSTLMAADRMGMAARVIEIDPRYVDVIVKRWEHYSGRQAVRQAPAARPAARPEARPVAQVGAG